MSPLFLKHGKFAIVSVLFPPKKNCKLPLAQPSWACQRLLTEKATKLFMTHKSVKESRGPSVHWSHRFFHCLAIFFFFCCCMSFSHTHTPHHMYRLASSDSDMKRCWERVQRHLLLLQRNSYKTFQSKHRRKWFPRSHNSVEVPQCGTLIVWFANVVMSITLVLHWQEMATFF